MNPENIEIKRGLSARHRRRAAEIYYEAFRRKLDLMMGSRRHSLAVLEMAFDAHPNLVITAVQQERLVGLAGLQYDGHTLLDFRWSQLACELGWFPLFL